MYAEEIDVYVDGVYLRRKPTGGVVVGDRASSSGQGVYFMTHEHQDVPHRRDRRTHASDVAAEYMRKVHGADQVVPTFHYDALPEWYTVDHGLQVYVFRTEHCCGSVGYFFPSTGCLFLGDGRITEQVFQDISYLRTSGHLVLTCFYDNLFDDLNCAWRFPTVRRSLRVFESTFLSLQPEESARHTVLQNPHSGVLEAIRRYTSLSVDGATRADRKRLRLHFPPDRFVQGLRRRLIVRFGSSREEEEEEEVLGVRLSSLYFLLPQVDGSCTKLLVPVFDDTKRLLRFFVSFHASREENGRVRRLFEGDVSGVEFIGCTSRHREFSAVRRLRGLKE